MKRFWDKVDVRQPNDCWTWKAATNGRPGYGAIGVNGRGGGIELAHRMSWKLTNGDIPEGLYVLHSCDNRLCVNPNHLFIGTQADNLKDMRNKGRGHHASARGERNYGHKLTAKDVSLIRREYKPFVVTNRMLAEKFGVTKGQINKIVKYRSWN